MALVPKTVAIDQEESDLYPDFSARAEGTNIDPVTLLATDYLNHFNEIVMLLDLIADMPDCLLDAESWQPKSYQQHFADSQFRDKTLAIEAYDHVPRRYRQPFDDIVTQINRQVPASLQRISAALSSNNSEQLRLACAESSRRLQTMIDIASAIIHGSTRRLDQAEIDGFLAH